jgi:hypothetical protein
VTTHSLLQRLLFATISATLLGVGFAQTPEPAPSTHSAGANSTAPFLALTHTEALTRAKAENKPLLLFFDGHWSERAGEVRPEIFADPTVIAAINDHALALRIDVLAAPEITQRYKISHVPTLVWVHADGTPGEYWINCEKPDRIRTALVKKAIQLPLARKNARPDDPASRHALARALIDNRFFEEAFAEARWLYDDALQRESGKSAKKKTAKLPSSLDALKLIAELSPNHPLATKALLATFEPEKEKIRANKDDTAAAEKFCATVKAIGEPQLIWILYDEIPNGKARAVLRKDLPKLNRFGQR